MSVTGKSLEILLFLSARHQNEYSGNDISRALGISSGTLYPLLVKLKQTGMIDDRWEEGDPSALGRPRRRYYRVCGLGIRATEEKLRRLDPGYSSGWFAGGLSGSAVG
jgi:PadR family transcriptional regulator, regulatory protein PadR